MATFQLLLTAGDISPNPGPVPSTRKNSGTTRKRQPVTTATCPQCEKTVRKKSKRVLCEVCLSLTRVRCSGISGFNAKQVCADTNLQWTCQQCLISVLPSHACPELDSSTESVTAFHEFRDDEIQEILNANNNHLKIMHLNTQAMLSTFNEFLLTMKTYPMELLEYVSTDGYQTEFRNREIARGGGVGAYIKESVPYKRRYDIEKTQPDLEHLWLERIPGRNNHSKMLLGVIYRSVLVMTASNWLECLEDLLSNITSTWNGMIVLTGDVNFDLLCVRDSLVSRHTSILDMFGLEQMVTKPTRVT